jgi:hypothetical protein
MGFLKYKIRKRGLLFKKELSSFLKKKNKKIKRG